MAVVQWLGRFVFTAVVFLTAANLAISQNTNGEVFQPVAILAELKGPIGPASTRHIKKIIAIAGGQQAEVIILRIDTPGGLVDAMRDIIQDIIASPVPIVGYVAPPGAHAASAGTYILYATHVAAMAPGTNLGAATPVLIGGLPGLTPPQDEKPIDPAPESNGEDSDATGDGRSPRMPGSSTTMTAKATNDAVAFIRSLAELRGRNADWAEAAVRDAASLSSARALEKNVIDLVATDAEELLVALDGRTVLLLGEDSVLSTSDLAIERIEMGTLTTILAVLSNPNVALILMMIGVYGIIFEFWNPGALVPGVVGAISLTLGLYALNQLPLNYTGLALVGLGIAFMVAEAFTPTFGILGFGGLSAFVLGSAMLVDTDFPAYQISWWVIGTMAGLSAAVLVLLLGYTMRAYRLAPAISRNSMLGKEAVVIEWKDEAGFVWAEGERWRASGMTGLSPGAAVYIRDIAGLTLHVTSADDSMSER
ncbi:NfeD family protein [Parasedimentitalea psychrophila]|uniref:Nodulation protein NfeD n=1 Tax=Parasedimentitalea psychrophila TaxID=2997337 RepID=A0A9Y2KYK8_9RHOB|nr:nodulation protein NfeD [Parasedimentitalea psychrophila]WIY24411.1 nodulation protein NfeD [Parasedimentitalea psychrophila]